MIKEEIVVMSLPYSEKREKTVRVYVPAHEEGETFPVIYMTDGQNLFEAEKTLFGSWLTPEAVKAEQEKNGKGAIIVGIHNDGHPLERSNDLMPLSIGKANVPPDFDEQMRSMISQDGEIFAEFVVKTVMPEVEKRFPVKTGRKNTAFCGSSSGGLESLFIGLTYSDLFCAAGVFSMAPLQLIYDPDDANKWLHTVVESSTHLPYLYFYAGGADEMEKQFCVCMEKTCAELSTFYPGELMTKVVKPEQPHKEIAWSAEFKNFLRQFLSMTND